MHIAERKLWPAALLVLGLMPVVQADYEAGVGAYYRADYQQALMEFQRAAEDGDPNAQYNVGLMYLKGEGTTADQTVALRWFRRAARQGQTDAQTFLGALHADGQGVPKDYLRAARWFTRAAEAGHPAAQGFLGQLYADGLGVPQDRVQAYLWWSLAEANGYREARALRERLMATMSPTELARAEHLTQERWPNWARQDSEANR